MSAEDRIMETCPSCNSPLTIDHNSKKCDHCRKMWPLDFVFPAKTVYACDCGWEGTNLDEAEDVDSRVDPFGPIPAGECPECGFLVYDPEDEAEWEERERKLRVFPELLNSCRELLSVVHSSSWAHLSEGECGCKQCVIVRAKEAIHNAESDTSDEGHDPREDDDWSEPTNGIRDPSATSENE